MSPRNQAMLLFAVFMPSVAEQGQSVFTPPFKGRQSPPRLSLEAVKTANDTSNEFGRLMASIRVLAGRFVLISTTCAPSFSSSTKVGVV